MDKNLILPQERKPDRQKTEILQLIPVVNEISALSKLTVNGYGLGVFKPKLLTVDAARMADEQLVNKPGVGVYNYDKLSVFGTPVFDTIVLNNVQWTDFSGIKQTAPNFQLDIAIVEVNQPRVIIRTPITGRNGTVKEYMSDGDYEIKITGSLVNSLANTPPEILIRALSQHCKAQVEIPINSTFLSYLDIYSIVIVEPKFMQRHGTRNVIDYELNCISETPFELKNA